MSRYKLLTLISLVLLISVPAGVARAQEEIVSVGTAVISDSVHGAPVVLSGTITYNLSVPLPAAGIAYEGWLVTDDGSEKLSTGVMTVESDGSVHHHFTSPDGRNLIHSYDRVLITEEPVPDPDPGPSGVVLYGHAIPRAGMAHIRHLLTNWPSGTSKGILTNLKEQLDVAVTHAELARASADQDDLDGVRQHIEHVINAIEGEEGPNFGDLNGDGLVQDFGDGVGVLKHAQDRQHGPFAAGAASGDDVIVAGAALVDITGKNAEDWATLARDVALNDVLPAGDITAMKISLGPGFAGSVIESLKAARRGFDSDGDGTIESIEGEGGADQAYVEAQRMATYTLLPGPPSAPTAATGASALGLGLPSVGDPSVPVLAQMALIASLVLLGAGGGILIWGRRFRKNT